MKPIDFRDDAQCDLLRRFVSICSNLNWTRESYLAAPTPVKRRAYLRWQTASLIELDRFYASA
jgi:hypothetical protein